MAFNRRRPIPNWRKEQIRKENAEKEFEFQEKVVGPMLGLTDEDLDAYKACICPKKNCPVHPD